jgi:hypothetical protein
MTTRLRSGFFVESQMKEEKQYFFGYLTHAGLEYDIAFAIPINDLEKYCIESQRHIPNEGINYKLGMLETYNDTQGNDVFSVKIFVAGKIRNLILYPSQYDKLLKLGYHINTYNEGILKESFMYNPFVNLNQQDK